MKKILFSLLICIILCFPMNGASAMEGKLFASNTVLTEAYLTLDATSTRAQTFTAAVDNFTGFYAYLNDRVNGATIVAYLINESTQEVMEDSLQRMGSGNGWEEFTFNSPLSKESVYRVKILVPNASGVKWVRSGDVYAGGWHYYGAGPSDYDLSSDLVFQAWGYDNPVVTDQQTSTPTKEQTASQTATTAASGATTAEVSPTASETPVASVATSIAKPTELKAVYNKTVDLSWKGSATSDVDGYKIFRSETKGKNYSKIDQVAKTLLTYSDKTTLAGKTYYYVVRAYKGSDQSGSSNEASVTISASANNGDTTLSSEESISNDTPAPSKNYVMWILVIAALVLTLVLLILIKRRQDKTKRAKAAKSPRD